MNMSREMKFLLCRDWDKNAKEFNIKTINRIENKVTGAFCHIGIRDDLLIVCFKGTELKCNDIITDMMFAKMRIPYDLMPPKIKVHSGFIMQYHSIRAKILKVISAYNQNYKIYVIGHSLGGSLATLCILDIQYNFNINFLRGYAFGSPRVGNKHFRKSFNGRVDRFFNIQIKNDWVCKLPLWIMGFRHVGKIIKKGKCKIYPEHQTYDKYL